MMSKITAFIFLSILILLFSCGRRDPAVLVNNTADTVNLSLKLNYPHTENCPDNYLREQILSMEKSQSKEFKLGGDCLVSFNENENVAQLVMFPNDVISLGTVRMPLRRNDYKCWEFTEIKVQGKDFEMKANGNGIMSFVKANTHFWGGDNYEFIIGTK